MNAASSHTPALGPPAGCQGLLCGSLCAVRAGLLCRLAQGIACQGLLLCRSVCAVRAGLLCRATQGIAEPSPLGRAVSCGFLLALAGLAGDFWAGELHCPCCCCPALASRL